MGYEDAASTKMLASFCACCSRPLRDTISVEAGVGPECREKHGYAEAQGEADWVAAQASIRLGQTGQPDPYWLPDGWNLDAHKATNVLVHHIALHQDGRWVLAMTEAVRHLGFHRLASRIAKRVAKVRIRVEDGVYVVKAPFDENAVALFRRVAGRRWDGERKVTTFPMTSRTALWRALQEAYRGFAAEGPQGLFTIGG